MDISLLRERASSGSFTVTELNSFLKNLLDSNKTLSAVTVTGEISNLKDHGSGHLYFSLKDADAQIKAVMFRSQRSRLKFVPEDGMRVTVCGSVSVYSQTGSLQIYANSIEPDGIGALYLAYEQLKARLAAEGLFEQDHKKLLPPYPQKIGVITSPSGAAVRDIINVIGRRFPIADIYVYPALVQGNGSEDSLIKALDYFEESSLVDLIIIGRGGGSIEDLWAFNGERLARKIYGHSVPIISAVGHETDFTICDFVSDLRAPTPSAAAEIAVPDMRDIILRVDNINDRLASLLIRSVELKRERLNSISRSTIFFEPDRIFDSQKDDLGDLYSRSKVACDEIVKDLKNKIGLLCGKADAMSPLAVLKRGYAVCENKDGTIAQVKSLTVGEQISVIL
ncbi:MAG: exodeoxyribonuclease VII large subunit, partial [Clostridia bacterium]|nr:exodeoxyribonuclease VII large subunit [Clostridia bacterium]